MKIIVPATNREFKLVKAENKRLPKRFAGTVKLSLNGTEGEFRVTNNRAWCGTAADSLEYIWMEIDTVAYYITLNYGEAASEFAGVKLETADGIGPKPAARVTATDDAAKREATRVAKFKTWAENRA